jgi:Na+/H+-dicarboxylate symporter
MSNRFTQYILAAMVLGIIMGSAIYNFLPDTRADWASFINLIAMMFLRLIKMIIAPLVFATLVGEVRAALALRGEPRRMSGLDAVATGPSPFEGR